MSNLAWFDLTFTWWWMVCALPVPWVLRMVLARRSARAQTGALYVPFFQQLAARFGTASQPLKTTWWQWALLSLAWVSLVCALMRPTWVGEKIPLPMAGRDIMLAIDLSESMAERDLGNNTNRLSVVKQTADDFIARREGDRIGLVFFSSAAYLQAPLTFDRVAVRQLLSEANVGLTGRFTAIGDAIAIAVKRLRESQASNSQPKDTTVRADPNDSNADTSATNPPASHANQVMILLTDGANNAGMLDPQQATAIARQLGIKIYTIGVGSEFVVVDTLFGRQKVPNQTLDEQTLKTIAERTGGRYFRATDAQALDSIYRDIDALEPTDHEPQYLQPEKALYFYPALLSLLAWVMLMALSLLPNSIKKHSRTEHKRTET